MSHDHHDHPPVSGSRLVWTIVLNVGITVAQVIGGLLSGSLALLADALHNFSDVIALLVSWVALRIARRPPTAGQTYGYKRAEIMAALFNGAVLVAIAVNLCIEAVSRFGSEKIEDPLLVIGLALLSIVVNGVSVLILQRDAGRSLNMRSSYLHLLSDMLTSVAVMLGGIAIYYWDVDWVDGLLSIVISLYLIWMSIGLLRKTVAVIMQFAPKESDLDAIERDLTALPGVAGVHHVHLWQLTEKLAHFEGHLEFEQDLPLSQVGEVIEQAREMLHQRHDIEHVTLQPEFRSGHASDTVLESC